MERSILSEARKSVRAVKSSSPLWRPTIRAQIVGRVWPLCLLRAATSLLCLEWTDESTQWAHPPFPRRGLSRVNPPALRSAILGGGPASGRDLAGPEGSCGSRRPCIIELPRFRAAVSGGNCDFPSRAGGRGAFGSGRARVDFRGLQRRRHLARLGDSSAVPLAYRHVFTRRGI